MTAFSRCRLEVSTMDDDGIWFEVSVILCDGFMVDPDAPGYRCWTFDEGDGCWDVWLEDIV